MTPGLPQEANKYCDRVGRVMNYGDGLYGGMFVASLYSAAFFENDPRRVVERALASLPAESSYARAIRDVLDWSRANPGDWRHTWQQIENNSYNDIVRLSVERAIKVAQAAGGTLTEKEILIPNQPPLAPKLEQWSMGKPDRAVNTTDEAWSWKGAWTDQTVSEGRYRSTLRVSLARGDEATLTFTGTAIALVGQNGQDGGRARIHLDGKLVGEIDSYVSERTLDHALWHTYGLQLGKHVLRIVTTGEADKRSSDRKVAISRAMTFQ